VIGASMETPTKPAIETLVSDGIAAYGRGDHLGAHESFEHAWLQSGSPRSLELHALAQLAAAVHKHIASHKPDAARAIMARARTKLGAIEGSAYAIDLERLRREVDAWLDGSGSTPPALVREG